MYCIGFCKQSIPNYCEAVVIICLLVCLFFLILNEFLHRQFGANLCRRENEVMTERQQVRLHVKNIE